MSNSNDTDLLSLAKGIPELDTAYAVGFTGGSEQLYERTLKVVIRHLPANIAKMDAHIADCDLGAFAVKVHGVKGSLNQIGGYHLAKLAQALEKAAKEGNRPYCEEHYAVLKKELLRLYSLLIEAASLEAVSGSPGSGGARSHFDALSQAKKAVLEYDALKASDILAPLAGQHFGGAIDPLISKSLEALGAFKHKQALEYIEQLLETCKNPAAAYTKEEEP